MNAPQVSYVLATDRFETVREVVRAVAGQTVKSGIELVLVCPSQHELGLEPDAVDGIGDVRVIEVGTLVPLSHPRAAGIHAASAPIVFVGETHSFPEPSCLETLLAAHREGHYAVVMPAIVNGNPERASSWANLMVTYRLWLAPAERGEVEDVSTYNGCFRRELLVAYGDRLPEMLEYGSGLDRELKAQGYSLLLEPAATLQHLNVASIAAWLPDRFLGARIWGAARGRRWSLARRLAYALASPLIPLLLIARVLRSRQWADHRSSMPAGTLPGVVLSALAIGIGEAAGYLIGSGSAPRRVAKYELHRDRYI
jgi:hypothetical protein